MITRKTLDRLEIKEIPGRIGTSLDMVERWIYDQRLAVRTDGSGKGRWIVGIPELMKVIEEELRKTESGEPELTEKARSDIRLVLDAFGYDPDGGPWFFDGASLIDVLCEVYPGEKISPYKITKKVKSLQLWEMKQHKLGGTLRGWTWTGDKPTNAKPIAVDLSSDRSKDTSKPKVVDFEDLTPAEKEKILKKLPEHQEKEHQKWREYGQKLREELKGKPPPALPGEPEYDKNPNRMPIEGPPEIPENPPT